MTLQEQIDSSFGDGPEAPPLELTLAAGHRALRRRRIGVTLAAAAVITVVGTGVTVAATHDPTGTRGPDLPVATGPLEGRVDEHPFSSGQLAAWTEDGAVQLREGTRIVQRVDDPVGLRPGGDSVGLVLERGGERQWLLLTWATDETNAVRTTPERAEDTFDGWLGGVAAEMHRQTVRNERDERELDEAEHLVGFGQGETLALLDPTAKILDQMPTPVGNHLPPEAERSAVAMLRWHDETWFVLLRDYPGSALAIYPTPARWADDARSIEEYLAWRTGVQQ
ncbi:hypothetical protein [Nocardioides taihuensis]|uniref:Uncharacterized protein n=1 Tax=Nocardioides taihuensis TaxID=1835606 RepID=A0ABW0BLJ0_9ACTN